MKKRLLSILLCALMLAALLPAGAAADGEEQLYLLQNGPGGSFTMQQTGLPCGEVSPQLFAISDGHGGHTALDESWIVWADPGLGSFMWMPDMRVFLWNTMNGAVPGANGKVYAKQGPDSKLIYAIDASLGAPIAGVYSPAFTGNIAENYCSNNTVRYTTGEAATAYIKLGCPDMTGKITETPICNTPGVTASLVQGDNTLVKLELAAALSGNVTAEISIPVSNMPGPMICTVTFTDAEQLYFHGEGNSPYVPGLSTDAGNEVLMRLFKLVGGEYVPLSVSAANVTATIGEIVEKNDAVFWDTGATPGTGTITVNDNGTLYRMSVEVFPAVEYLSAYQDEELSISLPASLTQSEAKFTVTPRGAPEGQKSHDYDLTVVVSKGDYKNWIDAFQNDEELAVDFCFKGPDNTAWNINTFGNTEQLENTFENLVADAVNAPKSNNKNCAHMHDFAVANKGKRKAVITPHARDGYKFLVAWLDSGYEVIYINRLFVNIVAEENFKVEADVPEKHFPESIERFIPQPENLVASSTESGYIIYAYDPATGTLTLRPAVAGENPTINNQDGPWTAFQINAPTGYQTADGQTSIPWQMWCEGMSLNGVFDEPIEVTWYSIADGQPMREVINLAVEGTPSGLSTYWTPLHPSLMPTTTDSAVKLDYNADTGFFHVSFPGEELPSLETLRQIERILPPVPEGTVWIKQNGFGRDGTTYSPTQASAQRQFFGGINYTEVKNLQMNAVVGIGTMTVDGVTIYYNAEPGRCRGSIMEFYGAQKNLISSAYYYGVADDFVKEVVTESRETITEPVTAPTIVVHGKSLHLVTKEPPQDSNGKNTKYFQMELEEATNGEQSWVVYLPYDYIGIENRAQAEKQNLSAPLIRHYDDNHTTHETIVGEYTDYGIKFTVSSFSPFTIGLPITYDEDTKSVNILLNDGERAVLAAYTADGQMVNTRIVSTNSVIDLSAWQNYKVRCYLIDSTMEPIAACSMLFDHTSKKQ